MYTVFRILLKTWLKILSVKHSTSNFFCQNEYQWRLKLFTMTGTFLFFCNASVLARTRAHTPHIQTLERQRLEQARRECGHASVAHRIVTQRHDTQRLNAPEWSDGRMREESGATQIQELRHLFRKHSYIMKKPFGYSRDTVLYRYQNCVFDLLLWLW
jgi:hypothetical protein